MLDLDEVHAFSPQTFIDAENRKRYGDDRWQMQLDLLHDDPDQSDRFFDLASLLATRRGRTRFHIHYARGERLDGDHAKRLVGLGDVILHEYDDDRHNVVKGLRDNGTLERILHDALSVTA